MFIHKLIAVTAVPLGAAIFAPGLAGAAEPKSEISSDLLSASSSTCALRDYQITSVKPYKVQEYAGAHTMIAPRTLGTEVNVAAQPGLTAEWLWKTLTQSVAQSQGSSSTSDCPLDVDKVQVEVFSAGPGFTVRLTAPDEKSGKDVFKRAQLLAR